MEKYAHGVANLGSRTAEVRNRTAVNWHIMIMVKRNNERIILSWKENLIRYRPGQNGPESFQTLPLPVA